MNNDSSFLTAGVRAMFLSTLAFFLANTLVKQVSHIPAMEVVFFRCAISTVFCFVGLHRAKADWKGSNRKMLFLRGFFGTTALFLFFTTLQNIPLASAMTIQYLSPIFTSVIAIFVLSEKVRSMQWFFYAIAFGGVLLIEQFDPRISPFYLIIGIVSAFCSGVAYNLVRSLRGKEHPLTVVLHFQLTGAIVGFISLFFAWRTPEGWDWIYLVLIAVFSQLGQIFLTNALQKEAVAGVAIVNYTGLVYALLIGSLWFGESQSTEAFSGMLLVVLGVLLSVFYSKRMRDLEKIESTVS
ncbi:MAG: DMT family transporter [Acidobacteria bacterium]|nr:DMT family transporter [Acidobacteriota bacterium]